MASYETVTHWQYQPNDCRSEEYRPIAVAHISSPPCTPEKMALRIIFAGCILLAITGSALCVVCVPAGIIIAAAAVMGAIITGHNAF